MPVTTKKKTHKGKNNPSYNCGPQAPFCFLLLSGNGLFAKLLIELRDDHSALAEKKNQHRTRLKILYNLLINHMHSSRDMFSLMSKVYYSLFLPKTLLTSVLTWKYTTKLPLSLCCMWLLCEVYFEHHSHGHLSVTQVLDRCNPLKRFLQKHLQKSRYGIYKKTKSSNFIKWQSSRSLMKILLQITHESEHSIYMAGLFLHFC